MCGFQFAPTWLQILLINIVHWHSLAHRVCYNTSVVSLQYQWGSQLTSNFYPPLFQSAYAHTSAAALPALHFTSSLSPLANGFHLKLSDFRFSNFGREYDSKNILEGVSFQNIYSQTSSFDFCMLRIIVYHRVFSITFADSGEGRITVVYHLLASTFNLLVGYAINCDIQWRRRMNCLATFESWSVAIILLDNRIAIPPNHDMVL